MEPNQRQVGGSGVLSEPGTEEARVDRGSVLVGCDKSGVGPELAVAEAFFSLQPAVLPQC